MVCPAQRPDRTITRNFAAAQSKPKDEPPHAHSCTPTQHTLKQPCLAPPPGHNARALGTSRPRSLDPRASLTMATPTLTHMCRLLCALHDSQDFRRLAMRSWKRKSSRLTLMFLPGHRSSPAKRGVQVAFLVAGQVLSAGQPPRACAPLADLCAQPPLTCIVPSDAIRAH